MDLMGLAEEVRIECADYDALVIRALLVEANKVSAIQSDKNPTLFVRIGEDSDVRDRTASGT